MKERGNISRIESQIARCRKRHLQNETIVQGLRFITILAVTIALLVFSEAILRFAAPLRTIIAYSFLVFFIFLFARLILLPLMRLAGLLASIDDESIARQVGEHFPSIKDRLVNVMQIRAAMEEEKGRVSSEFVDEAFRDLSQAVRDLDFSNAVNQAPVRRAIRGSSASLVLAGLLLALFPTSSLDSFDRLVNYNQEFAVPHKFEFTVLPGDAEIVKGNDVEVSVLITPTDMWLGGRKEYRPTLRWKAASAAGFDPLDLQQSGEDAFHAKLRNVRSTFEYFVELEGEESDRYQIIVVDRPIIRSFQIRLIFPRYTRLPLKTQEEFVGDVTAPKGTEASIRGEASKELREGSIVFGDGSRQSLILREKKFHAAFMIRSETTYRIELRDIDNLENVNPVSYTVNILPDENPSVAILYPGRNLDIAGDQQLPLIVQARDDYAISRLRLGYRLSHSRYEASEKEFRFNEIPYSQLPSAEAQVTYAWNLSPLRLVPEDVIEYFAEAWDNDEVSGPKSTQSQTYLLRLPSIEEVFAELDKGHEQSLEEIEKGLETARELRERIESIAADMKKNKEIDWQQQKRMEDLAKRYEQLQQKIEKTKNTLDQMIEQMQQQNVLSAETLEKYLELQQLFQELNSEELNKALRQMQQAMQNLNRDQMQQAMQQLTFSEERFRSSIERTMNLLKRIQIEQKLDELKKRADVLTNLQSQLNEESGRSNRSAQEREEIYRRQNDLQQKQTQLEETAANLHKRMEEFFTEMPADRLEQLNRELSEQELADLMRRAAQELKNGNMQSAQQLQQQIQQALGEYARELGALQEKMLQQHSRYAINELRRAIQSLLELSRREESLKSQTQSAPPNSPLLRENAQNQMRIAQDLQHVIAGLAELSQRSFAVTPEMGKALGEALARMHAALRSLEVRSAQPASQEQQQAMAALNKASMQVQNALQTMMQAGGGGGMAGLMQQLQAFSGQQMSINAQTRQLGEGSSQRFAEEAARLAMEQEAVRKSLEQLNREAQASGEQNRILGDLERIGEEMREVVRNLEQMQVNPETIQKQDRILSRLLDAARSMRERDFEKRRRAQTGSQTARRNPNGLDPETLEGRNRLYEDLLKALEQGYSKDYQELIRKYFEELRKIEKK